MVKLWRRILMSVIALTNAAEDEMGISENYQTMPLHCAGEVNDMDRNLRNYDYSSKYRR